jgi:hypothetical protein
MSEVTNIISEPEADPKGDELSIKSPRIVFIRSLAHSGSTLLDMLISSHPDVVSVGEVVRFNKYPNSQCACQRIIWDCPFWKAVEEVMRARFDLTLRDLQQWAGDRETFERHNLALFDGVREVSGKHVIVDSSKHINRLKHLVESEQLDVLPIHLIRNPLGVVYSHVRRGDDWRYHARQYAKGLIATQDYLRRRPHIEVRYDDLVNDPNNTLARVMEGIGLNYDPDQLNWAGRTRHNCNGNRKVRYSENSTIRMDSDWRKGLTRSQKFGVSLLTLRSRIPGRFHYDALRRRVRKVLSW